MRLVLRADPTGIRKAFSLACSLALHGAAIAWALLPGSPGRESSDYEIHIRPHAARIVWYSLKQTLPPISPAEPSRQRQPARALTRSPHTLVAGKQDLLRPPQLIWIPAPPLAEPRLVPSPNIVALAPPARPRPRAFVPPPEWPAKAPVPVLPAAPELAAAIDPARLPKNLLPPVERARKTFIPPVEAVRQPQSTPLNLPAAPALAMPAPERILFTTPMAKPLRDFHPPEAAKPAPPPPVSLPDAPQTAPQNRLDASFAIAGLLPARQPQVPIPTASQEAGFSTGPQPRPDGSNNAPDPSQIAIPGLLARSGTPAPKDRQALLAAILEPPTSARNLLAAAANLSVRASRPPDKPAFEIAEPPDPRLRGRIVYSMALQMPNVTSYSGSWLVWFAERGQPIVRSSATPPPDLAPPYPVHKVDPKYVPSAIEDRVEGAVRLAAVIRKDGKVDQVEVLHSLDERLDRSAAEALAKWEFEPARRAGAPIDVDAVFEIPFHLAPRAANSRPSP
ncbi:MAG TPA: energy transducer TonB [Bryobacteraceae bacterium]|nr:energy transducer TonB [Bryobacteraceae bacterium]